MWSPVYDQTKTSTEALVFGIFSIYPLRLYTGDHTNDKQTIRLDTNNFKLYLAIQATTRSRESVSEKTYTDDIE